MQPYRDVRARAALDTPTAWATRADSALRELGVVELFFDKEIEEETIDFPAFGELFGKNVEGAFDGHCFLIRAVLCR